MINVRIQPQQEQKLSPKITVVGVGGAGCNAVNNMIATQLEGVEFIACNTDAQALEGCLADTKIQLGASITSGLGAGANPEIGRAAAEETIDEIVSKLDNVNMVFVTCGMGGGTGTGAAPIIARAAREKGVLTVGVVTKPFHFEGAHRMKSAESGIEEMQQYVDTLIVIPNQNLFRIANEKTTFAEAFKMADTVLQSGVRGVTDLMVIPGLINLDFADVRAVMLEMGKAMMGTGEAEGERRAIEAAEKAINNPLLDDISMKGAQGVIINITGGYDMTLFEADEACNRIRDEVDPDANIIFGSTFDEKLDGKMRVSIVATGIESEAARRTKGPTGFAYGGVGKNATINRVTPKTSDTVATTASQPVYGGGVTQSSSMASSAQNTETPATESVETNTSPAEPTVGTRQGESYIPPQPVETTTSSYSSGIEGISYPNAPEVEKQTDANQWAGAQNVETVQETVTVAATGTTGTQSYTQQSVSTHQTQGVTQPQEADVVMPKGLVLNPPKQPEPKKRPPSLFERFTGAKREDETGTAGGDTGSATGGSTSGGAGAPSFAALRAEKPAQQGSLAIDTPTPARSEKASTEEDLDIPAFLRRQAN